MNKIIMPAFAALGAALVLSGCVNRLLAESYQQYLDTVGSEYLRYVENDPALTDDDRTIRRGNHSQAAATAKKFQQTQWSW